MQIGQSLRRLFTRARRAVTPDPLQGRAGATPGAAAEPAASTAAPGPRKPGAWKLWLIALIPVLIALYYILGSALSYRINDDLAWRAVDPPAGASRAVAAMAGLVTREVDETLWSANTPGFAPQALLRFGGNMPNFQSGLVRALSVFSIELEGRLARSRGTSGADEDVSRARQWLAREPDTWILNPLPTSSADSEYRKAAAALLAYNARVSQGQAIFDLRSDNLQATLDRIALDIGDASDTLESQVKAGRTVFIDRRADKVFYNVKGRAYAYHVLLSALKQDFAPVIAERRVARIYDSMLADLALAASLHPMIVQNGSPEAAIMPNHLTTQGFYLMRARAKLREITDILQR